MLKIKTLQQRFVVSMLLPVALLLCVMGAVGFVYGRNAIITQWEEAAILRLRLAAHHVDLRLARPKERVNLYLKLMENDQRPPAGGIDILKELADQPGGDGGLPQRSARVRRGRPGIPMGPAAAWAG